MEKLETNIITPERNTGKDADIIEDLETMAQSIQAELNKKPNNSITEEFDKKLEGKVDKKEGKGLSTNDFTNLLKEKLENLENYNDTEIRNLLNGSLKGVNYTASNGMLTFTKNDGSTISVDLPLELLIESGRYDEANSQIVLVLANGNSINIPVSDLLDDFYGKGEIDTKLSERDSKITKLETENKEQQNEITTLQAENKTQTERIETLEKENANQAEELETLWKDYKEKEVEGETVAISDGIGKIKDTIYGMSKQNTTEGYNLLNPYKVFASQIEAGLVKIENGKILLNGEITTSNRTIKVTLPAGSYSGLETQKLIHLFWKGSDSFLNITQSYTFEEEKTLSGYIQVGTYDNLEIQPMIYSGSYRPAQTYEQFTFGASPNPNYEQDIEVITECSLVHRGIQLLDYKEGKFLYDLSYPQYIENGFVLNAVDNDHRILTFTTNLKANKRYIIDFDFEKISGNAPKVSVFLPSTEQYLQLNTPFTPNANTTRIGIYIDMAYVPSVFNVTNIRLYEEQHKDKPYEPYIEPIVHSIDLAGNELVKINEYKDRLLISANGNCKIDKNIHSIVLEKTHTLSSISNIGNDIYRHNIVGVVELSRKPCIGYVADTTNGLCTHLKYYCSFSALKEEHTYITKNSMYLYLKNIKTEEELATFLNVEKPRWYYPLGTPEVIDLPSIEPITLFEGTNVFELVTNLGTTMKVEYKVSNKSRLEALENAVLSLGGNV